MRPLEKILEWFDDQDKKIQLEFVSFASTFHVDESIRKEKNAEKRLDRFRTYFKVARFRPDDEIQRALFIKSLISYTLSGKETIEHWETARSTVEKVAESMKLHGGKYEHYDSFMKDYEIRKTAWVKWAYSWKSMLNLYLTDEILKKWRQEVELY